MRSPSTIAITGASSGLGAALAREYAAPGKTLFLVARRAEKLEELESVCRQKGAVVFWRQLDVRDVAQTKAWVSEIEKAGPLDLLIANAGIFSGRDLGERQEPTAGIVSQIETNLLGTCITVNSVIPLMKARRAGHIAMVSSLAALQPLADAPSYSASKAGIMAFGEALRELLFDDNITVSVILPGNIETAQTANHIGSKPGIISAQTAARLIRTRLDRRRTFIAFPRSLLWLIRLGRLFPWRIRAWANKPFRFHVEQISETEGEP